MLITALTFFLPVLVLVVLILAAAVLLLKYQSTKDVGLLWLVVAGVIWPVVSRVIERRIVHSINGGVQEHAGVYQYLAANNGQMSLGTFVVTATLVDHFIGASLLLLAALHLYRGKHRATPD
jgi:hypothetical protein